MLKVDEKTLNLIKIRDEVTLKKIFSETNPYLLKILSANRFYAEQAEEILQNAWLTFFKNLEQFKGESQIKVFVTGILLNKIREQRRLDKKIIYEEDSEKTMQQRFSHDGWWNEEPTDPSQIMNSKQIMTFIRECLEGLSEAQREAFCLREIDGEHSENICNILGLSISNLGVLIFRAKDKLKKCLEGKINEVES